MAQTKKHTHSLYTPLYTASAAKTRKSVGKPFKKLTDQEVIAKAFEVNPALCQAVDSLVMAHDVFWARSGKHTIFLDQPDVPQRLMAAQFDVASEQTAGLTLPFESFRLALPKGTTSPAGHPLPGIQVTWIEYEAIVPQVLESFFRYVNLANMPDISNIEHQPGERALVVNMLLNHSTLESMHTVMLESRLPDILAAETVEEFHARLGSFSDGALQFAALSPDEQEQQYAAIRLVCALGVFNAATEGQFLKPGFPGGQAPRTIGGALSPRMDHHTLAMPALERASPEEHYRAAHYRQLRHERYYQGDYATWPRGSRWAYVRDTWVRRDEDN